MSSSLEGFKITDANIYGSHGEVGSLAATLDMLKQNAEDVHKVFITLFYLVHNSKKLGRF